MVTYIYIIIASIFNILLIIGHNHTAKLPCLLSLDRALDVHYEPNKIIENIIIISLTYAAGKTNKDKLAELKSALQLVKTSSDK
jgi:hypothetical protein